MPELEEPPTPEEPKPDDAPPKPPDEAGAVHWLPS